MSCQNETPWQADTKTIYSREADIFIFFNNSQTSRFAASYASSASDADGWKGYNLKQEQKKQQQRPAICTARAVG